MGNRVCLVVLNEFTNDSRVLKEARSLMCAGYDVLVLALHAHGLPEWETVSGIRVRRVKLWTRGWSKRKPVQLVKYMEFVLRASFLCRGFDVLHCNDLNALPVGVLSKALSFGRRKIVYDAHEFEMDCSGPISRRLVRAKARFEGVLIRYADAVITVSPSIAKAYRRIYGISTPSLVLNCPPYRNTDVQCDKFREELGIRPDQKIFLYQGGLSPGRGVEKFLEAFSLMPSDEAVLVCMGYGPLEQAVKEVATRSRNVFFREAVAPSQLLDYTASADVGLVFIEKNCMSYVWCLPNKFFEYLMAGLMVLCSDLVEPRRIIQKFDIGICTEGGTPRDLEDGVLRAKSLDGMEREGILARDRARRIFCWETQERILLDVYAGL